MTPAGVDSSSGFATPPRAAAPRRVESRGDPLLNRSRRVADDADAPVPRSLAPHGAAAAGATAAAGSSGDPHLDRYAARTTGMTASEIRALFAVASRPEVVSLAGGMPNLAALPLDSLGAEVGQLIATEGQSALQYGSAQGVPVLREQIGEVMAFEADPRPRPADSRPTTSWSPWARSRRSTCSPACSSTRATSCSPSRRPTSGPWARSRPTRPRSATSRWTTTGWSRPRWRRPCERLVREGRRAKFLYTVPNFHNPVGVSLATDRRPEVVELCRRYGVLIVEDNPYGLLGFDGQTYPSLRSLDPENVVYLGSFSKTSRRGCGSAGRSRRTASRTSSSSPPSRRRCVRRRSPSSWSRATSRRTTGAAR